MRESLGDAELNEVLQVAGMGFDQARVARTYMRLKKDQAKVREVEGSQQVCGVQKCTRDSCAVSIISVLNWTCVPPWALYRCSVQ